MNKKVLATMPEKEKPKNKVNVTLVQPKEVVSDVSFRRISGTSYKKIDAIAYAEFVQMAQQKGKGFGDAKYGKIVKVEVDSIFQHPLNMKWFDLGDNFNQLYKDIGNRGVQSAIGLIKVGNQYLCIDGNRRVAACKRLGIKTVEARIATREMTEKELEYHIIMANISPRDFSYAEKVEIALKLWPNIKKRLEEQLFVARNGGKIREVQGIPQTKEMASVMKIPEREVEIVKARLKRQIQQEKRGKNLIDFGDSPNQIALNKFQVRIVKVIDTCLSGENTATIKLAQKYLEKKSRNLYSK